jgi:hypothetical protein
LGHADHRQEQYFQIGASCLVKSEASSSVGKALGCAREGIESGFVFTEMQLQRISRRIPLCNITSEKTGIREGGLHRKEFRCGFGEYMMCVTTL